MYVGIAVAISAIFYFLVQVWLFAIMSILLVGGSLAISFIKVEGRPLFNVITSAFHFYWKPQTYIWKPEESHVMQRPAERESGLPLEAIASGMALHKTWENLQTGTPMVKKSSDRQFIEKKMSERYQIFQKLAGDREAARRVDYR